MLNEERPHIGDLVEFSITESGIPEKARIVALSETGRATICVESGMLAGMVVEDAPLFPIERGN